MITKLDNPMGRLIATVEPVTTAKPGALATFHVRLANPTGAVIPLDPCPGYHQERFSVGTATVQGINDGGPYRLNCRAVHDIASHGSVRYAMGVHIPTTLSKGRKPTVTWRLAGPRVSGGKLTVQFTLTSTG